ncbi:MAG: FHA domain-containing protein [Bdellovibrionales bacterium]
MKLLVTDPITQMTDEFSLRPGLIIGRKEADIVIEDPKISTEHAILEIKGDDLFLVDLGTKSKIRHEGQQLDRLLLKDGTRFRLGTSPCSVTGTLEAGILKSVHLEQCLQKLLDKAANIKKDIYPFDQQILLNVQKGPLSGEGFFIGYGPRVIGNGLEDVCLKDWSVGELSFQLVQHEQAVYLLTNFPEDVKVNGEAHATIKLKNGDLISIGSTEMQVDLNNE